MCFRRESLGCVLEENKEEGRKGKDDPIRSDHIYLFQNIKFWGQKRRGQEDNICEGTLTRKCYLWTYQYYRQEYPWWYSRTDTVPIFL